MKAEKRWQVFAIHPFGGKEEKNLASSHKFPEPSSYKDMLAKQKIHKQIIV